MAHANMQEHHKKPLSRPVADAFGVLVLRGQRLDPPAGHGKAEASLDPIFTFVMVSHAS